MMEYAIEILSDEINRLESIKDPVPNDTVSHSNYLEIEQKVSQLKSAINKLYYS